MESETAGAFQTQAQLIIQMQQQLGDLQRRLYDLERRVFGDSPPDSERMGGYGVDLNQRR